LPQFPAAPRGGRGRGRGRGRGQNRFNMNPPIPQVSKINMYIYIF
jgi:hypothetical protein